MILIEFLVALGLLAWSAFIGWVGFKIGRLTKPKLG